MIYFCAKFDKSHLKITEITAFLEQIAPLRLQESYDNAGLIVGDPEQELTGALICLDSTEEVVREAIQKGCNLVIAHHPIVFRGLKRITGRHYVERVVIQAIKNDVALYAIHTNLDNILRNGVNQRLCEVLGLQTLRPLVPKPDSGEYEAGSGMIGQWPAPMSETESLRWVAQKLNAACIRHTPLLGRPVQKVAVCGGAGSFLLPDALRAGADLYISADFKYHEFFEADGRIVVADTGHFESEQFTINLLFDLISEKYPTFALHCVNHNTNPVRYWV